MSDPIKHVVFLMMENRSFDHMLGGMAGVLPGLDGADPNQTRVNLDLQNHPYKQAETRTRQFAFDPKHDHVDVMRQLANNNSGFVSDFSLTYPNSTPADRQEIMGYFPADFLPAMHPLARDFTVCDRWYSSLPGPTWPNRFFALTGTSMGRVIMPTAMDVQDLGRYFQQTQETVFGRLSEAGRSWKVYFNDFPSSWLLLRQLLPDRLAHYRPFDEFFKAVLDEKSFPDFIFIEPMYFGADENDDHPPHNVMKGEKIIADVYNAVHSSPDLWNSTLLVVTFDEHGGFYDNRVPPGAVAPDNHQEEYTFDQLGIRVPALLISPWVSRTVEHTQFDHTSLLRYVSDKWNLGPLGNRTAAATSIACVIRESEPRTDTIPFIRVPYTLLMPDHPEWEQGDQSNHHSALAAFVQHLEAASGQPPSPQAATIADRADAAVQNILSGKWKLELGGMGPGAATP